MKPGRAVALNDDGTVTYIDDEFDEDDTDDCACDCEPCYDGTGHCGDDFVGCHEHG